MVGFEPTTPPLQTEYSDQTELHPDKLVAGPGLEPGASDHESEMLPLHQPAKNTYEPRPPGPVDQTGPVRGQRMDTGFISILYRAITRPYQLQEPFPQTF